MDKKAKKRIDVLNQKLLLLRQQLSGAKKQPDDLSEITRLEKEVAEVTTELEKLRKS